MNNKIFAFLPPVIFVLIAAIFYVGMQKGDTGLDPHGCTPKAITTTQTAIKYSTLIFLMKKLFW